MAVSERAAHWRRCAKGFNSPFLAELDALEKQPEGNEKDVELEKAFGSDIAFGTAGLRARMAAGWAFMNDVTVRAASQGFAAHLKETYLSEAAGKEKKDSVRVVIGFDSRHHSKTYLLFSPRVPLPSRISCFCCSFLPLFVDPVFFFSFFQKKLRAYRGGDVP
jgi:Phosphoglucomutase/phosphomannomutase, alpha/beta/alpha domain I